jgi:hypothetical protein
VFVDFVIGIIEMDKSWMQETNRLGNRYAEGVKAFISMHVVMQMDMIGLSVHVVVARIDIISI